MLPRFRTTLAAVAILFCTAAMTAGATGTDEAVPVALGQAFAVPSTAGTTQAILVDSATPGQRMAVVAYAGQDGKLTMLAYVLVPLATPGPTPTPALTGLAKVAHDLAVEVGPTDGRPTDAKRLAEAFRAVASQIAAGALTTPEAIVAATLTANQAALGDRRAKWAPWAERLMVTLNTEAEAGRLKTPAEHQKAWLAIAQGLEAVQ
jgi:hypothetical protein